MLERQSNDGENEESLSGEDQERFNKYIQQAKKLVGEGNVEDALRYNKKALKICHKEKLAKKIKKMEVGSEEKQILFCKECIP